MGHRKLFYFDPKTVRDSLNSAIALAEHIHKSEHQLVEQLLAIDQKRFYVRYGYKTLTGFCRAELKFSRTQAQRIVTQVRRLDPTA